MRVRVQDGLEVEYDFDGKPVRVDGVKIEYGGGGGVKYIGDRKVGGLGGIKAEEMTVEKVDGRLRLRIEEEVF